MFCSLHSKNPPTVLCFLFNVRRFYATCFSLIFSLFSIVPGSLTKAIVTRFYITCHVIWQNCSGYSFSKILSVTKVYLWLMFFRFCQFLSQNSFFLITLILYLYEAYHTSRLNTISAIAISRSPVPPITFRMLSLNFGLVFRKEPIV